MASQPKAIYDAFLSVIDDVAARIDIDELAGLLARGRTDEAIAIVAAMLDDASFEPFAAALGGATLTAGQAMATIARRTYDGVNFRFNALNPRTTAFIQGYVVPLIRELSAGARATVRQVVEGRSAIWRQPRARPPGQSGRPLA